MKALAIQTPLAAMRAHVLSGRATVRVERAIEQVTSGYRINRAADDAAGLAIANKFRADVRSLQVARRNIAEATSMLQIAEGGVASVGNILERMKELATQAASENASGQLSALDDEYQALVAEIDRLVGATNYQGSLLLDGSFAGTFQVGGTNTSDDQIVVSLGSALGAVDLGLDTTDLLSGANARTAMDAIDSAIDTANSALGDLGALQNRLSSAALNVSTTVQNYQASESVIRDADMASVMTEIMAAAIVRNAGLSMLAQANASNRLVLDLVSVA